jgi:hypothetical protein
VILSQKAPSDGCFLFLTYNPSSIFAEKGIAVSMFGGSLVGRDLVGDRIKVVYLMMMTT